MTLVDCSCVRSLVVAAALAAALAPAPAQAQRLESTGIVATGLLLRQMDGVKRVLMIGAHPDDEDTSLLATLARGQGVETAYLSLTRGDGGQNLIGPELWEGLGIVRTGELMSARRVDGGQQFFTRAFDYGFSKSADEALSLWPREELLRDVVWTVRSYRPQIIVSVFSGTPLDGHGQHQAAGIMAREAFAAAGDPARFPEQLTQGVEPWAPAKLYQTSRRRFFTGAPDEDDGSIDIETGSRDPLLGGSLYQLAMESRSQHRSQDMGTAQPAGPRLTGVLLIDSRVDDSGRFFSGVDTTIVGVAAGLPAPAAAEARRHLEAYRTAVQAAVAGFGLDPESIAPQLFAAKTHLTAALNAGGTAAGREFRNVVQHKLNVTSRAIMAATGVSFDVRSADDLLVPGQAVEVSAELWNGGSYALTLPETRLTHPGGWEATLIASEGVSPDRVLAPGAVATWRYLVKVPREADPSRLYYLRAPRDGARYRWPDDATLWGLPRDPVPVAGLATFGFSRRGESRTVDPGRSEIASSWRFVGVDPASGEFEKPVLVVPAVSVTVAPAVVMWPQERAGVQSVSVVVRSEAESGSRGTVTMAAPAGWTVTPASQDFVLAETGSERVTSFDLRPAGRVVPGRQSFEVVATTDDGTRYAEGYSLIDYGHIERAALYAPAEAVLSVVPLRVTSGLRVGYIMGSGDDGPEAIRQMGAEVETLNEDRVRDGDFASFSTIVLGVRAYETRPDLQAAASQLLDFAAAGGTVVVQYNRGPLGSLAPYDLEVGRGSPRVADETATVRVVEPGAPVFTGPNRITGADFNDWVQERGLYFAAQWDPRYVPLLSLNDAGEEPRLGSLLVTSVGDGVFVYTALSFFRQWSGQVPGAYRLFANLISLDGATWSAFATGR